MSSSNTTNDARDQPIYIKLIHKDQARRFRIPYGDTMPEILPHRIRSALTISDDEDLVLERYSDSAACYILLDDADPAAYRQLRRAARAKSKLRIRVTTKQMKNMLHNINQLLEFDFFSDAATASGCRQSPLFNMQSCVSQDSTSVQHQSPSQEEPPNNGLLESAGQHYFDEMDPSPQPTLSSPPPPARPSMEQPPNRPSRAIIIDCNACHKNIRPGTIHYHCGVCEEGDYDLCATCFESGIVCDLEHWLIKRELCDAKYFSFHSCVKSKFERSCKSCETDTSVRMVEVSDEDYKLIDDLCRSCSLQETADSHGLSRTCNVCLLEKSNSNLAVCLDCKRTPYRICTQCLLDDDHGHSPFHEFELMDASKLDDSLVDYLEILCKPGRATRHQEIRCDKCYRDIEGIRHKCLQCPDFDYCRECFKTAPETHPYHAFASLAEPLPPLLSQPLTLFKRDDIPFSQPENVSDYEPEDTLCTTISSGPQLCERCYGEFCISDSGLEQPLSVSGEWPTQNQLPAPSGISAEDSELPSTQSLHEEVVDEKEVENEQDTSVDDGYCSSPVTAVEFGHGEAQTVVPVEPQQSEDAMALAVLIPPSGWASSEDNQYADSGGEAFLVTVPPEANALVSEPLREPVLQEQEQEQEPEQQLEQHSDLQPEVHSEEQLKNQHEQETELQVEQQPEKQLEQPEQRPEQEFEQQPELQLEVQPEEQHEQQPELHPEQQPEQQFELQPEVHSEEQLENQHEQNPELQVEQQPETQPEVRPEMHPEERPEEQPEAKPEHQLEELLTETQPEKTASEQTQLPSPPNQQFNARCCSASIRDGTTVRVNTTFTQTWELYNPGPLPWPAGCSVYFAGGDIMLNHDYSQASGPTFQRLSEGMRSKQTLEAEVQPGTSFQFSVDMRVPPRRDHKYRTYIKPQRPEKELDGQDRRVSFWKLKDIQRREIGDNLWCDVLVEDDDHQSDTPALPVPEPSAVENKVAPPEEQETVSAKQDNPEPAAPTVPSPKKAESSNEAIANALRELSLKSQEAGTDEDAAGDHPGETDGDGAQPPDNWRDHQAKVDAQFAKFYNDAKNTAKNNAKKKKKNKKNQQNNDENAEKEDSSSMDTISIGSPGDGFDDEREYDMMLDCHDILTENRRRWFWTR